MTISKDNTIPNLTQTEDSGIFISETINWTHLIENDDALSLSTNDENNSVFTLTPCDIEPTTYVFGSNGKGITIDLKTGNVSHNYEDLNQTSVDFWEVIPQHSPSRKLREQIRDLEKANLALKKRNKQLIHDNQVMKNELRIKSTVESAGKENLSDLFLKRSKPTKSISNITDAALGIRRDDNEDV